jgi:hypothetical protein
MYKSDQHYNQMAVALNGDKDWAREALRISGHEYEDMYLTADHGVSAELHRARVHDDLILYSGITDAFVNRIAGIDPGTQVTADDLIASIGSEYEEKAMMSTSASFKVSYGFTGNYGVMTIILASQDALNSLGSFCLDCFMGSQGNNGELELHLDAGARFTSDNRATFPYLGKGHRVPSFDEALEAFPSTPAIIEIKTTSAARAVRRAIEGHHAEDRVVVDSLEVTHVLTVDVINIDTAQRVATLHAHRTVHREERRRHRRAYVVNAARRQLYLVARLRGVAQA